MGNLRARRFGPKVNTRVGYYMGLEEHADGSAWVVDDDEDLGETPYTSSGSEFATAAAIAWRTYHPGGDTANTDILTADEERLLARRIAAGCEDSRRQLIAANYRLVFHVVSRFRHTGVPIEDLIQEGNLGLIEAVDRFDPKRGCRFNTYALLWIRGAVLRAATRLRPLMPVPERLAQAASRMRREEDVLSQELQRQPTADEVADRVGLTPERVEETRFLLRRPTSLDTPDSEDGRSPEEWLVADCNPEMSAALAHQDLARAICEGLDLLTPREREVLRLRFGLDTDDPRSLAEVGRVLDISRQRARELEQSALRRLRHKPPSNLHLAAAGD
ncbi:MAG: RNA polymerase sigma factor RpoD/SigA [Fimbriimonadaceae bacterium]|nr:RNA polymerase sigma factor RpoD/SigA [Fimbriimonadaceae bacterium]